MGIPKELKKDVKNELKIDDLSSSKSGVSLEREYVFDEPGLT